MTAASLAIAASFIKKPAFTIRGGWLLAAHNDQAGGERTRKALQDNCKVQ
ncbi:hypothetical protein [Paenibacillus sp. Leaf72]|nr:hypothetical protein [Paenibacillus sp. Leaf72]